LLETLRGSQVGLEEAAPRAIEIGNQSGENRDHHAQSNEHRPELSSRAETKRQACEDGDRHEHDPNRTRNPILERAASLFSLSSMVAFSELTKLDVIAFGYVWATAMVCSHS
jgi:hypothetical protein